jgi:hypothetical protein
MELRKKGRRVYLSGLPYAHKDIAKDAGCTWDAEAREWWTGKQAIADDILKKVTAAGDAPTSQGVDLTAKIIRGRATHQGAEYYYSGISNRDGALLPRYRLISKDGQRSFWGEGVTVVKVYDEPTSIQALRDFASKQRRASGSSQPQKACWECGCLFTARDANENGGDWGDGYCGC